MKIAEYHAFTRDIEVLTRGARKALTEAVSKANELFKAAQDLHDSLPALEPFKKATILDIQKQARGQAAAYAILEARKRYPKGDINEAKNRMVVLCSLASSGGKKNDFSEIKPEHLTNDDLLALIFMDQHPNGYPQLDIEAGYLSGGNRDKFDEICAIIAAHITTDARKAINAVIGMNSPQVGLQSLTGALSALPDDVKYQLGLQTGRLDPREAQQTPTDEPFKLQGVYDHQTRDLTPEEAEALRDKRGA
ncbi:hypothetical protein JCM19240_3984 [Vibrio maritimus]|uniref:Uncharacterized protein n=1 Tax=Vibrio maritimus TaxID=990268 RepID=A0A090TG50_9VIBR|nr:hypothetical protein JCM19240_3984 [Vibrio maritimus]